MVCRTLTVLLASTLILSCQSSSGKKNSVPTPEQSPGPQPPDEEGGVNLVGIETVSKDSPWKIYGELQQELKDGNLSFASPKEATLYFTLVLRKHTKTMPSVDSIKRAFAVYFMEDNTTLRTFQNESELKERAAQQP
jgi:hypothetical protein